jgi:hypothetical protein
MNSRALILRLLAPAVLLVGCDNIFGIDNYDEPNASLSGRVVFEGQPVGVRTGGVELELWQPGFELNTKIPIYVAQDGTFSARLFAGSYELNLLPGNGPWVNNPERIRVEVQGETSLEVPVRPFYTIRNESITNNGGVIQANFSLGHIDTSRQVEWVGVYVGTTNFVDRINQRVRFERQRSQIPDLTGPISLSVTLPADIGVTPSPIARDHVFVRIGVKTVGVAEMLFSPVHRIAL